MNIDELIKQKVSEAMVMVSGPTTDTVEIQRTDKWFADRLEKFTGSKFSDIMKKSRGAKEWGETAKAYMCEKLIERLTGYALKFPETWQMRRGTDLEPVAKQRVFDKFGYVIDDCEFLDIPGQLSGIAGASPDGKTIINNNTTAVEIKCRNGINHFKYGLTPVDESHDDFWQLQGEMMALNCDRCLYVNFNPEFEAKDGLEDAELLIQFVDLSPIHVQQLTERILRANTHVDVACKLGLSNGYEYLMSL